MRVAIIREDNAVNVDGVRYAVDCSTLPADVHAVQWNGVSGEVEYSLVGCDHCGGRSKKPNEFIKDFSPYDGYVHAWAAAKIAAEEAEAAKLLELQEKQKALNAPG